jgi:DNA-binding transcriptional regulator GbsR (MarR family)
MPADIEKIEKEIYSLFAEVAGTLGYSEVHGRIIAALLVRGGKASLQELAKETGYSVPMVSLSLDLLEFFGMVKKVKHVGDRRLYVELQGNLLDGLKKAFLSRLQKSIENSLKKFEEYRKELKSSSSKGNEKVMKTLEILEKEIKRLQKYLEAVSKIKV